MTTWAWVRPFSCWPWKPSSDTRIRTPAPRCCCARCHWSATGSGRRRSSRPACGCTAHHGGARLHGDALRELLEQTDLIVSTYTTATRDIDELAGYEWNRVVLDEAQAVKNSLSRAAKAVRQLRAGHRVALTGTPMENRLAELWSIVDFLNPGLLGSSERFRTRYAIPIERHGQTEPAERLRAVTRPYILRRVKTDPAIIDDLPEKIEIKQYCQLTTEQASLYQAVVADMMDKIENTEGIERRGNVLAAMTKLKQVCNHPAQLLHDPLTRRPQVGEGDPARGDPGRDPGRRWSPRCRRCAAPNWAGRTPTTW